MASKALKIVLIGCGVVFILGVIGVGVGGYFLKKWGGEKLKTLENIAGTEESEYGKKTAKLSKQYPFEPPEDNVITENQIKRFLVVRKDMYSVYQKYEPEFKKLSPNESFSGAVKGLKMWNEIKLANANALEKQRMSPEEYTFLVSSIYTTWFAKGTKEALKDQTLQDTTADQLKKTIEQLDKQIQDPATPEETKKALQTSRDQLQTQLESLSSNEHIRQLDRQLASIPQENIELLKKYEPELKKYSMAGLEFVGL